MTSQNNVVSIHPYFKVHPGKLEAFKAALPALVEKTRAEQKNLYYDFTVNGNEVFCREAYVGAEGLLTHVANVDANIKMLLTMADLSRVEVHGPAAELESLRDPLAGLKPAWFTHVCGVQR
jgi:quinol monooxygenase YgiN